MARDGLLALLCAVALFGAPLLIAAPPEDNGGKLASVLAVQKALQEGRDALQRGDCKAAVFILESQVARIDGNRDYLAALREAYRGYVRELQQANRHAEVSTYQTRLEILDGGAALERTASRTAAATLPPPPGHKAVREPAASGVKVRAQIDGDPFHDDNRAPGSGAQGLLEQAEREFVEHHYASAGRLFEQASRIEPSITASCQERWAYCKLYGVVEALNKPAPEAPPPQELEQEVRRAMSMAPKLDDYGKDLLRKIQERRGSVLLASANDQGEAEPVIQLRHLPRNAQGWSVAETVNFRVFHTGSRELAERVARIAEATRTAMIHKWFSDSVGTWNPRCDLFIHAN